MITPLNCKHNCFTTRKPCIGNVFLYCEIIRESCWRVKNYSRINPSLSPNLAGKSQIFQAFCV